MTSSPTFDAGHQRRSAAGRGAVARPPGGSRPSRSSTGPNGVYVPGSVMKVLTAAAALDAGDHPETTRSRRPRRSPGSW